MKRKLVVYLIITLFFSALAGSLLVVNFTAADPIAFVSAPDIRVAWPVNNKTYNVSTVPLTFTIPDLNSWGSFEVLQVQYYLDGRLHPVEGYVLSDSFSVTLPKLTEGEHVLSVHSKVSLTPASYRVVINWNTMHSSKIHFAVDTVVPRVSILSPQWATYNGADFSFNFSVSESTAWLGYSLDGRKMVTVSDVMSSTEWIGGYKYQLVLSGLHPGAHSLTVYAEDLGGNRGASEPFNFIITYEKLSETGQTQETSSETDQASTFFLTETIALGIAIIASVALVSFGLLAYFVKRSRKKD